MKPESNVAPPGSASRRVAFPLTARILLWFLLNLLFLGGALFLLIRWQFRLGLDSLLAGQANQRVQALAEVVASDLAGRPREEWDAVLRRSSDAYHVELGLFAPDGRPLAGSITDLPPAVANRVRFPGPRPGPRGPEGRGFPPPPTGEPGFDAQSRPRINPHPPDREGEPPPGSAGPAGPAPPLGARQPEGPDGPRQPPFVRSSVRAGTPARYWILIGMPLQAPQRPGMPPLTLVLASDSLRAGGLLFDFTPWLVVGGGAFLLSMLFWWPLVRGITRSLRGMTGVAEQIADGRFDIRLDTARRDELGQLARSLSRMAARLREAFTGQKRFLGETAHELCSPLARMELALGVLEQRSEPARQAEIADVREEVRAMSALVNDLLAFSKADVAGPAVTLRPIPLAPLLSEVVRKEGGGKPDIILGVGLDTGLIASPDLLGRALGNVLRNAVRYAGDAGPITIRAERVDAWVHVLVSDSGPGVPEAALHRLFDPFFRPEAARTRERGGAGLGLAIVKSCIEACGGSVAVRNLVPRGFCVELRLPSA